MPWLTLTFESTVADKLRVDYKSVGNACVGLVAGARLILEGGNTCVDISEGAMCNFQGRGPIHRGRVCSI